MRKTVTPPTGQKDLRFTRKQLGRLLGIEGRIVWISDISGEVTISMTENGDGSRDVYHLSSREYAEKVGIPPGYHHFITFLHVIDVKVVTFPDGPPIDELKALQEKMR